MPGTYLIFPKSWPDMFIFSNTPSVSKHQHKLFIDIKKLIPRVQRVHYKHVLKLKQCTNVRLYYNNYTSFLNCLVIRPQNGGREGGTYLRGALSLNFGR